MNNKLRKLDGNGFTIMELLIATTIFAVVLLLATLAVLQVGRAYYKGTVMAQTQSVTREAIDNISQAIQFSAMNAATETPTPAPAAGTVANFCINNQQYTYVLDRKLVDGSPTADQTNHGLLVTDNPSCSNDPGPVAWPANGTELLGINMRLAKFEVVKTGSLYSISIKVIYGDEDLLTPAHDTCKSGADSQFCAVSELNTTVQKRL